MISWLYKVGDWARNRARKRQWTPDQAAGRRGEDLAHRFLRRRGFVIVARNYRPSFGGGEIDLIGWDADTLVFVEVKSRTSGELGNPEEAVDFEKQRNLERTARDYVRRSGAEWHRVRFDIVSVIFSGPVRIELFTDVFHPVRTI